MNLLGGLAGFDDSANCNEHTDNNWNANDTR